MAYQGETAGGGQLYSRLTYPNPFSPSGIDFDLPQKATVSLTILDSEGHEVANLIKSAPYDAGTHHVEIGSSSWARGLSRPHQAFYYRLVAEYGGESHIDTKKLIFAEP
jgi:hypothetical protein